MHSITGLNSSTDFRNFSATDELVKCKVTNAASAFGIDRPQLDFTINGVNDHGDLVGFYTDSAGNTDGMLARP